MLLLYFHVIHISIFPDRALLLFYSCKLNLTTLALIVNNNFNPRRTDPQRISITPSTTGDSSLVLHRYHNSSNSLSDSSAVLQGLSSTVVLPGSLQATASQTIHLPSVVTVQASALAELGSPPVTQRQHRRGLGRRSRQMSEPDDIELSAVSNIRSSNGVSTAKARAGAAANVVQVQLAGSMASEQKSSRDSNMRPSYQGYNRALKVHPEKSVSDSCTCSEAATDHRSKRHATKSFSRDSVINENARHFSKSCSRDSIINENAVLFTSRAESKARTQAQPNVPRNVQFQVSANATSNGETSVATAECSSTRESLRTSSSHSRSSPGLESLGRASTSQSLRDPEDESSGRWSLVKKKLSVLSLSSFARDYYGPWLQRMPMKVHCRLKLSPKILGCSTQCSCLLLFLYNFT